MTSLAITARRIARAAENSPPNVQRLFQVIQLADFHIDNNASIEELYAKIDALGLSISDFNS